jgi:hypothetical protein
MKKTIMLYAAAAVLAGCGGGDSTRSFPVAGPAAPAALAPYVGTWVSDCWGHQQETIVVSVALDGSVVASTEMNWYPTTGCAGSIVATEKMTANFTVTHNGAVDAVFALCPCTPPKSVKVDRVTWTVPAFTRTVTGSGVSPTAAGEVRIAFDNDESALAAAGPQPGYAKDAGLHTEANELFILSADGDTFKVDYHYKKKQ